MSKKIRRPISILTSITTIAWLSGIALLAPIAVGAAVVDGDLIRNPNAEGMAQFDIYIVKVVGDEKFKRLILSPHVFESYEHFDKNGNGDNWDDVIDTDQATMDAHVTTDLVRPDGQDNVYRLYAVEGADTGTKYWLDMTAEEFLAVFDADAIYTINDTDVAGYTAGSDVTDPEADFPPEGDGISEGTLSVTLAADTPAAGVAVENAARLAFTKVNLKATGGDVIVDSLIVERAGLASDNCISSLDIIDAETNLPINITSKTFNSLHQATFNDDFTVSDGTTKSIILAANMPSSLDLYAGQIPALSLASMVVKGEATLNATLPITGNTMTTNANIVIGTATIQRGAYGNASTSIQVGKEDYTFFSFQVQAGSPEKVQFSQIKVYQGGSASLGTDVINLELLQDGTKVADGVVASAKYVYFNFDTITLNKGQIFQYQVKADIADGSARTIKLGIYRSTDLLVSGLTYGYNITPTYSSTGAGANAPYLSDNEFTISNGTLQVTRSSAIGATNIAVANDQYLGAFEFDCKGEPISISELVLTVTSTGNPGGQSVNNTMLNVELVDPNGSVVAGPDDPVLGTGVVTWSDTFTVPVGITIYKVRGDLQTNVSWASTDTVYVSFTPSGMEATGDVTGNTISATPGSEVKSNTQSVRAAALTVTRNTLPADANIIVGQSDLVLSSWNFDASASGEDIRVTSVLWGAKGQSATNTNALTTFIDEDKDGAWDSDTDTALSPVNDAYSTTLAAGTSTFAFTDPIVIPKGTSVNVALKGSKSSVVSDDDERWGLSGEDATVIAYGVNTGNEVGEGITHDNGPTLSSVPNGSLVIETKNNPVSAIVLTGSAGNVFTNIQLTAKYEDLNLDQLIVYVTDGGYSFSAPAGNYQDVTNVGIYNGTEMLAEASIPSTGYYTFEFEKGELTIPKGAADSVVLTIKADMSTVNPDADNAPGTNSADLKIGIAGGGGIEGIKTTGNLSNVEISGTTYEDYRSSTSSAMVMRTSKPTVTLPTSSDSLGAATTLTDGNLVIYAFKITAASSPGGDILLFRTTFVITTSTGSGVSLTDIRVVDQNGNTIKAAAAPTGFYDGVKQIYYTATFDNPDIEVYSGATEQEAIEIPSGESRTFKVWATVAGANAAGENVTTFLAGDLATTSADVNTDNLASKYPAAVDFYPVPSGDLTSVRSNFIWSDNYLAKSISGTAANNATATAQWYNGHLVPGLGNVVSTTAYTISY